MRKGFTVLAILMVLIPVCGCIGGDSTTTAAPTTTTAVPTSAPPSAYTFPKYAYQLQEQIGKWGTACDVASAEWQSALETLRALAGSPDSTQDELYQAFADYEAAIKEYERVLQRYYAVLILSEHTEPTETGLLALMNETVPFARPEGDMCPYELLNIGAEGYMVHEGGIKRLIAGGMEEQEDRQELLDTIDAAEAYLPEYHDMVIGYVYYGMNRYLTCLSQCTDGSAVKCGCSTYFIL